MVWGGEDGTGGITGVFNGALNIMKESMKLFKEDLIKGFMETSTAVEAVLTTLGLYMAGWWLKRTAETVYLIALYKIDWLIAMGIWTKGMLASFGTVGGAATILKGILVGLSVPIVLTIGIASIYAAIKAAILLGKAVNEASQSNDVNIGKMNDLLKQAQALKGVDEEKRQKLIKAADSLGKSNAAAMSEWADSFNFGGLVYAANGFLARGRDTVPAMLSPGEMVLNKSQQSSLFDLLSGRSQMQGAGGPTINLNVGTMIASRGEQREFARRISDLINENNNRY
jgi:hypothetical protein